MCKDLLFLIPAPVTTEVALVDHLQLFGVKPYAVDQCSFLTVEVPGAGPTNHSSITRETVFFNGETWMTDAKVGTEADCCFVERVTASRSGGRTWPQSARPRPSTHREILQPLPSSPWLFRTIQIHGLQLFRIEAHINIRKRSSIRIDFMDMYFGLVQRGAGSSS